jgi:Fe-S cluster biogenesis protein NfuA
MSRTPEEIIEEVEMFLKVNFPQIESHGGSAEVEEYNADDGEIVIRLGDACDGCGISPMTIDAIHRRLMQQIDEIRRVDAQTIDANTVEIDDPSIGPFS